MDKLETLVNELTDDVEKAENALIMHLLHQECRKAVKKMNGHEHGMKEQLHNLLKELDLSALKAHAAQALDIIEDMHYDIEKLKDILDSVEW